MKMISPVQLNETDRLFPFRVLVDDDPNLTLGNHWHKEIEIIYLLNGGLRVYINGIGYSLNEGDIVIIVSGDVHAATRSLNNVRIVLQFDLSLIEDKFLSEEFMNIIRKKIDNIDRVSTLWSTETKEELKNIIFKLREEYQLLLQGFEISKLAIKSLLYNLIIICVRNMPISEEQSQISITMKSKDILNNFEKVFRYIDKNLNENITTEDVSKVLNFSSNYFLVFWKKYMGITFHSYLNQYRINIALTMLLEKDQPINQIAQRVGFNNIKTFNRLFKEVTGTSPSKYKKECF